MAQFVNSGNAKRGDYSQVINAIAEQQVCPFCPDQLSKFHTNPVRRHGHWLITDNLYPYKPVKLHLLLIHETHVEHLHDISAEAWKELGELLQQEAKVRGLAGGAFAMRFGDTKITGASVAHLHAHLVQSDPDSSDYDPAVGLRIRLG